MLIKLLPSQVPMLWDAIKYAAAKSHNIPEDSRSTYLTQLLHDLLSSKAVCFIRLNQNRELLMIHTARIMSDTVTGRRSLNLGIVYSFQRVSMDQWKDDLEVMKEFARKNNCSRLVGSFIYNKRLMEIASELGFTTTSMNVEMEVQL